jgi:hypothetical protein
VTGSSGKSGGGALEPWSIALLGLLICRPQRLRRCWATRRGRFGLSRAA